jgi:hypothetical protein
MQALSRRRSQCDRHNADLLVWTNERLKNWMYSIDLGEYAGALHESGK